MVGTFRTELKYQLLGTGLEQTNEVVGELCTRYHSYKVAVWTKFSGQSDYTTTIYYAIPSLTTKATPDESGASHEL